MYRSASFVLGLVVALGCSSKKDGEGGDGDGSTYVSSRDVVPDNAPEPVDRMLDGLVEREAGTILALRGYYSLGNRSLYDLQWILPDGTPEEITLLEDPEVTRPLIARDRLTVFFPSGMFEHPGTTVLSVTETAHAAFTPFSDENIWTALSTEQTIDYSLDGRFISTRLGTSTDAWEWTLIDTHTLQEVWRASQTFRRGAPEFLRGNIYEVDLYDLDYDVSDAGSGERVAEQAYRAQLTNEGLLPALDTERLLVRERTGANGSVWHYEGDAFVDKFETFYAETVASEPTVVFSERVHSGPFVVGSGKLALVHSAGDLYRITSDGDATSLLEGLDVEAQLRPLLDGVIAQLEDESFVYVDQSGKVSPIEFTSEGYSFTPLETGHLRVSHADLGTSELMGFDGDDLARVSVAGLTECIPDRSGYPIGKRIFRETDTEAALVFFDLSEDAPREVLRLTAKEGYRWSCPVFSVDGERLFATESAEDQALEIHRFDWTGASPSETETEIWDSFEFIEPVLLF